MKRFTEIGQIKSLKLLAQLKRNNFSALVDLGNRSELTSLKLGFQKILVPSSIELLHAFFSKDQKTIIKTPKAQYYTTQAIGAGLISTDQEAWVDKRKQVKGIFSLQQINSLMNIVQESIQHKLERTPDRISLHELFNSISINVIGHTLFGTFSSEDGEKIKEAVSQMIEPTFKKIISPFPFFVSPFSKLISRSRNTLFEILENNIVKARGSATTNLVKQYYPIGNCIEDVSNIFVAGFESTANTLFWLFYEINRHADIKKRLMSELNSVSEFEDSENLIQQIPFSIACVREVLRLYPPIWIMGRTSIENFSIGSMEVPTQTDIILSPYLFHRLDKYWDDPDKFNPSRFLNGNILLTEQPYYFPFGMGARACIGERLALMEIYLVLLNIFRGYSFTIESKEIAPQAHFTLRPAAATTITLIKQDNGKQTSGI